MEKYFELAIKEAEKALKKGEVPVGAIIVRNSKVIAKSHNVRQKKYDLLGHAEIKCILNAEKKIKDWRLNECDLYVTLEPCDMCNVFIKESRLSNVYYLLTKNHTRTNVCKEVSEQYEKMLKDFFEKLR